MYYTWTLDSTCINIPYYAHLHVARIEIAALVAVITTQQA